MSINQRHALDLAIKRANGITALARALGLKSHTVIQQWRLNRVPAEHCPSIEAITGIPCEDLRPDVKWEVLRSAALGAVAAGGHSVSLGNEVDGVHHHEGAPQ